jgi:hypothetical protein
MKIYNPTVFLNSSGELMMIIEQVPEKLKKASAVS